MTLACRRATQFSGAVLATLVLLSCAPVHTPTASPSPDQHRAALESRRLEEARFLKTLANGVQNEPRNDAWAQDQEAALRASYSVDSRLPRGALRTIDCRSSKCELQLQMNPPRQPFTAADQYHAVNRWIAAHQPCAYTLAMPPISAGTTETAHIYLDCAVR